MGSSPFPTLILILLSHTMVALLPTCLAAGGLTTATNRRLHPIILIPGSGGNQLEARLTSEYKPSSLLCKLWATSSTKNKNDGWFRLWFDPTVLLAPFTKCFAERMALCYNKEIDDYQNAPGVETKVPYFGSTEGLLYLDPNLKIITGYMAGLVATLESAGYREGETLFGAPYDFRYGLAAKGHPSLVGTRYLANLTTLIERATAANNGTPAVLLTHSLGGLFALHLLDRRPPSWRRRHIAHLLTLSAPWGGTVQEMLTYASGNTLGLPLVDPLLVRGEQRSSESNMWLLPSRRVFGETPLVETPLRSYAAGDMVDFLEDIGYGEGVEAYVGRTRPLVDAGSPAPGVPVTCVVGGGVGTPERLWYGGDGGFDEQPEVEYGDGDGTVNWRSLVAVEEEWNGVEGQRLEVVRVEGVSHTGVLEDDRVMNQILRVIAEINNGSVDSDLVNRTRKLDHHSLHSFF